MKINIWCDGTWAYPEEMFEFIWKSDDYATVEVPADIEDVCEFAYNYMNKPVKEE